LKSRLILTEPIAPRKVMRKDPHDHVLDVIAVFSRILRERDELKQKWAGLLAEVIFKRKSPNLRP